MTKSHVFPNYLIHYHFLPQKVNKYPFVLNVTGDYLRISLVISLLGGKKSHLEVFWLHARVCIRVWVMLWRVWSIP